MLVLRVFQNSFPVFQFSSHVLLQRVVDPATTCRELLDAPSFSDESVLVADGRIVTSTFMQLLLRGNGVVVQGDVDPLPRVQSDLPGTHN